MLDYLEASRLALDQSDNVDPDSTPETKQQHRQSLVNYQLKAENAYLPCVRKFHRVRGNYLAHVVHSPGTPFYPGRLPKRKRCSAGWLPGKRRRTDTTETAHWKPVPILWADRAEDEDDKTEWDRHQDSIRRVWLRGAAVTKFTGARVEVSKPATKTTLKLDPKPAVQLQPVEQDVSKPINVSREEWEDAPCGCYKQILHCGGVSCSLHIHMRISAVVVLLRTAWYL